MEVNDSTILSRGSSFSSFASRIIGNLGEAIEDDTQAPDDDDFRIELGELNDAGDIDGTVFLDDSANAPSDAHKSQTLTATTAVFEQETDGGGAAERESPESPDECLDQRMMDIV